MKVFLQIFVLIFLLPCCAWQTRALKVGQDTWQVSTNASPIRGGVTGARGMSINKANEHCDSLDKSIEVIDIHTDRAFPANGVATVTFKCL